MYTINDKIQLKKDNALEVRILKQNTTYLQHHPLLQLCPSNGSFDGWTTKLKIKQGKKKVVVNHHVTELE